LGSQVCGPHDIWFNGKMYMAMVLTDGQVQSEERARICVRTKEGG